MLNDVNVICRYLNGELQEQLRGADPQGLAQQLKAVVKSSEKAGGSDHF